MKNQQGKLYIRAAEYRRLRELMLERNQEEKFKQWLNGKHIIFTKEKQKDGILI